MQAYLIQAQADAEQSLHPAQWALGYGCYWVRFVDIANGIIEFGRVTHPHETVELEMSTGSAKRDALQSARDNERRLANHVLTGIAYSPLNPDGEWGHTHKAHVWPIEEALFNAAAEANWQIDLLPVSQKINLEAAFRAQRGHVRGDN